jgi:hypothetical protein
MLSCCYRNLKDIIKQWKISFFSVFQKYHILMWHDKDAKLENFKGVEKWNVLLARQSVNLNLRNFHVRHQQDEVFLIHSPSTNNRGIIPKRTFLVWKIVFSGFILVSLFLNPSNFKSKNKHFLVFFHLLKRHHFYADILSLIKMIMMTKNHSPYFTLKSPSLGNSLLMFKIIHNKNIFIFY